MYCIVQNFRGTKLLWLGDHVSICGKSFTFASKQCPQVPKDFEICRKTLAIQAKTVKVLPLKRFVLYGISEAVLKITIRSWPVIYSNRHFIVDYQWLPHWKCTVKYVLPNWIWSVIYQKWVRK